MDFGYNRGGAIMSVAWISKEEFDRVRKKVDGIKFSHGGIAHHTPTKLVLGTKEPSLQPTLIKIAGADSTSLAKSNSDYVCDGTNDEIQINSAISEVAIGGTIFLYDGTYYLGNSIVVNKPCSIHGDSKTGTIIYPMDTFTATPFKTAIYLTWYPEQTTGLNTIFRLYNLTITKTDTKSFDYCLMDYGRFSVVDIASVVGTYSAVINFGFLTSRCILLQDVTASNAVAGSGISFSNLPKQINISDCTASNNGQHGISFVYTQNRKLQAFVGNSTANDNGQTGIYGGVSPYLCIDVDYCTANNNGGHGIDMVRYAYLCTANDNAVHGIRATKAISCSASGNGNDIVTYYSSQNTYITSSIDDNPDAVVFSLPQSLTVVTSVDFVGMTTTTKTLTIGKDGRIQNIT
jgi:hypothetical protein